MTWKDKLEAAASFVVLALVWGAVAMFAAVFFGPKP